jgi:DeoR family transcriptional regulator, fructose operon transcriptional repressor
MFTEERHQALLELLEKKQRLTGGQLLAALRVSPATLRRDLADLEADRRLVRFHGGAAHPSYLRSEPTFEQKSRSAVAAKRAMAEMAAKLVPLQQTVFLDAGTSCLEVGRALLGRSDLTLIVNSIPFLEIARDAAARVICIGGEVRGVTSALVGGLALAWVDQLTADWAFIGASGLSADGPSTTELSETALKQALLRRSKYRVLVADSEKWEHPAPVRFAKWSEINFWITSADVTASAMNQVRALGPRVLKAKSPKRKEGTR